MKPLFLFTETAFHHEGDFDYLLQLIKASKEAGAQGVKFQVLMKASSLTSSRHAVFPIIEKSIFTEAQWREAFRYAHSLGLDIVMMPLDVAAMDLLDEKVNFRYVEVHSVSFLDQALLKKMRQTQVPVIAGIGGRTMEEIRHFQSYFGKQLQCLMVGFQAFPSQLHDVKMARIKVLKEEFPDMEIGYADHSSFDHDFAVRSFEYAYLLGATVFEKHITLHEGEKRTDFEAAVSPEKVKEIAERITFLDKYVNTDQPDLFEMTPAEVKYRNRQKVAVAAHNLSKGHTLTPQDLRLRMTDEADTCPDVNLLIGRKLTADVAEDQAISTSLVG